MISRGIELVWFAYIRLILKVKFGDDLLKIDSDLEIILPLRVTQQIYFQKFAVFIVLLVKNCIKLKL